MATSIEDLEAKALQLSVRERTELVERLIASLEGEWEDSPAAVAKAWEEEIGRRVAELESGQTTAIPGEQVFAEVRAMIKKHESR